MAVRRVRQIGDDTVAARIAAFLQLAQKPLARQVRPSRDAGAQVIFVRRDQPRLRLARAVGRRRDAALEVLAHRLAVHPELARDGGDAEPLPLQIMDQDNLSQCDHPPAPSVSGLQMGRFDRRRFAGGMPPANRPDGAQTGDFSNGTFGEITLGTHNRCARTPKKRCRNRSARPAWPLLTSGSRHSTAIRGGKCLEIPFKWP